MKNLQQPIATTLREFADFIAKENFTSTTLKHENPQQWQKLEVDKNYTIIEHPEITSQQLVNLFLISE